MGISIIGTIILSAYVACLCLTNLKTDPYKSPAFKLKKFTPLYIVTFQFLGKLREYLLMKVYKNA